MSKRLFVGGLPFSLTNPQLEEMFSQYGTIVNCTIITDQYSGQSKGFGFVELEDDAAADKAIEELNNSEVGGRKIVVNVARPMEERRPREDHGGYDSRRGGGGGYQRNDRGGGDRRGRR